MEFSKLVEEASSGKWSAFQLKCSDEKHQRLDFVFEQHSFYVTCPEKTGDPWQVWSDEENCPARSPAVLDLLDSSSCTLERILMKIQLVKKDCSGDDDDDVEVDEDEEEDDDDGEDDFAYYAGGDMDDIDSVACGGVEDDSLSADAFFTGQGSKVAVHRLLQDLKTLKKTAGQFGVMGSPRGDNLFVWDVELSNFEDCKNLHKDLMAYAKRYKRKPVVDLEMKFPKDYPMAPPFVRVIRPRFRFLTGHITVGGSVCMEMLTRSGWRPTNDIEGLLVSIRAEIMSDPNTHLDSSPDRPYSEEEARQAFERMVIRYGWNK